ncbi:MAG TPA: WD40 repeat domain-containing protein [Pyrinomonadaceae bacterium]|jgi:WD40 repeat protein
MLVAALAALAIAIFVAALYRSQRDRAINEERIARARQLAARAELLGNQGSHTLSTLLAIESMERLPSLEADQILRRELSNLSRSLTTIKLDGPLSAIACSSDGKYFALARGHRWRGDPVGKTVWVFEMSTGRETAQLTHDDNVNAIAFDSDSKLLATASDDNTVRIWDVAGGQEIARLNQDGGIKKIIFSPDGRYLAGLGAKHSERDLILVNGKLDLRHSNPSVRIWEVSSGKELDHPTRDNSFNDLNFIKTGDYLVISDSNGGVIHWKPGGKTVVEVVKQESHLIEPLLSADAKYCVRDIAIYNDAEPEVGQTAKYEIRDTTNGHKVSSIEYAGVLPTLTISPNGKYLTAFDQTPSTHIWDTASGREVLSFKDKETAQPLAFTPDSEIVALEDRNGVRIWNLEDEQEISRLPLEVSLSSAAFSPDGKHLITADKNGVVRIWETSSDRDLIEVKTDGEVRDLTFSTDGRYINTFSADGTSTSWDPKSGQKISKVVLASNLGYTIFSQDKRYLATSVGEGVIKVLDAANGKNIAQVNAGEGVVGASPRLLALSPSGKHLATDLSKTPYWATKISPVDLWDVVTGRKIIQVKQSGHIWTTMFSPDEQYMAIGGTDNTVGVWDVSSGREISRINHGAAVHIIAFSPDGRQMVTAGNTSNARLWNLSNGQESTWLHHDGGIWAIAFSPDGKYLVTAGHDRFARIWDVSNGRAVNELRHDSEVRVLVFSKDGRFLVTSEGYGGARVWEFASGREITHVEVVNTFSELDISPDGRYLAMGCCYTIWVWPLWHSDLIENACNRLTRNLTLEEWRQYLNEEPYSKTCPRLP